MTDRPGQPPDRTDYSQAAGQKNIGQTAQKGRTTGAGTEKTGQEGQNNRSQNKTDRTEGTDQQGPELRQTEQRDRSTGTETNQTGQKEEISRIRDRSDGTKKDRTTETRTKQTEQKRQKHRNRANQTEQRGQKQHSPTRENSTLATPPPKTSPQHPQTSARTGGSADEQQSESKRGAQELPNFRTVCASSVEGGTYLTRRTPTHGRSRSIRRPG